MDQQRFDRIARLLGSATTRRTVLAAAAERRRREWRQPYCDREAVPRDRLDSLLGTMRRSLAPEDGKALTALLSHGGKGTEYPIKPAWRFIGG